MYMHVYIYENINIHVVQVCKGVQLQVYIKKQI